MIAGIPVFLKSLFRSYLALLPAILIGLVTFVAAVVLHYQIAAWIWPRETQEHTEVRFPTP